MPIFPFSALKTQPTPKGIAAHHCSECQVTQLRGHRLLNETASLFLGGVLWLTKMAKMLSLLAKMHVPIYCYTLHFAGSKFSRQD